MNEQLTAVTPDQLTPVAASWQTALIGTRRTFTLSVADTSWTVRISPTRHAEESQALFAQFRIGDLRYWVSADSFEKLGVGHNLGVSDILSMPAQLVLGVLDMEFEDAIFDLEELSGATCEFVNVDSFDNVPTDCEAFSCELSEADGKTVAVRLYGKVDALVLLSELAGRVPVTNSDISQLPMTVAAVIGTTKLSQEELSSLNRGDVILLEELYQTESYDAQLLLPHPLPGIRVSSGDNALMVKDLANWADAEQDGRLEVQFLRGRFTLQLEEVQSLEAGSRIPFNLTELVQIAVGGRILASGELISIRERTGLRIVAVHDGDA